MRPMYSGLIVLAVALIITAGAAHGELFKSLECGISFDYPQDLKPSFETGSIAFKGPEGFSFSFSRSKMGKNLGSVEDLVLQTEKICRNSDPLFEVLESKKRILDGKAAIDKKYLIHLKNSKGEFVAYYWRSVYFKNGNYLILLIASAEDYYYSEANTTYITPLIDSLEIFAINEDLEENIPGFPKQTAEIIWSSPLLADINGDKLLEIIVGTNEGKLHVWDKDGNELNGFPFKADDIIRSSPAAGDVDGDGKSEIVFGSDNGKLYVLREDGSDLSGFPKSTEGGIYSSPALGDIDDDGSLEIAVGSMDTGLYAWKKDGSLVCGFPVITGSCGYGLWSSPALADLDQDGNLDVVVGATKYEENLASILKSEVYSGRVFAVNGSGEAIDGFPVGLGVDNKVIYSSPVLADIDGDGSMDIVIGSTEGLHCLNADGDSLPGFPAETEKSLRNSFIAVGDLEDDGKLEIVSGCYDGRLYVWRNDGSSYPGFPIQTGGLVKHVTLADINNDGKQEILGGSSDNRVHAWKLDGSEVSGFPKVTLGNIETSPTVGDLEGDGSLELAVGSNDGSLYVWRISQSYGKLDWPMVRQNPQHTGVFKPS